MLRWSRLRSARPLPAALTALALLLPVAPAAAQFGTGRLGYYGGCSIYACYQFSLTEIGRSGVVTPFPGGPAYPRNVPSYLVSYAIDGTTRLLPRAVADQVTNVMVFLPWSFNDGEFGEGGCCESLGSFSFAGLGAGAQVAWHYTDGVGPLSPLSGYVAVGAPAGTAGVSVGLDAFELSSTATDVTTDRELGLRYFGMQPPPPGTVGADVVTPEPGSAVLVVTGLLGLAATATARGRTTRR